MSIIEEEYTEENFFAHLHEQQNINHPDNIHYNAQCPRCNRNYNLIHNDCGEYLDLCVCSEEDMDTVYHCGHCLITFDRAKDWEIETEYVQDVTNLFELEKEEELGLFDPAFKENKVQVKTNINYVKCNHKHHEVKLRDGTKIYCSSIYDESPIDPDFGLYADHIWNPSWRNEFIAWPDGGLPTNKPLALVQIKEAYQLAETGKMVEIGCIGGHGRTGTILALMYLLSAEGDVSSEEAINFVRKAYCSNAIETYVQEWYVKYASSTWFGQETLPPEPEEDKQYCSIVDHIAMVIRGHKVCVDKGPHCPHFEEDKETYEVKEHGPNTKQFLQLAIPKLTNYDLAYGGFVLEEDDTKYPCTPLDHYSMIAKGHSECIRIGEDCSLWDQDYKEFLARGTVNDIEFGKTKLEGAALDIYNSYPTVEELEESKTNGRN